MSASSLSLGGSERASLRSSQKRRKMLRILWPSHCQDSAGWAVGWMISDCISVATIIPDGEVVLPMETRGSRAASIDRAPMLGETSAMDSGSVEKFDYSSGDEEDEVLEADEVRPPRQLAQKIELMNLDFAKQYWRTELQILGFFDPANTILRRIRGYGFGAVKEGNSLRPQMLYVNGRSDLVLPQQIVLYDQPRQNEMYCDMFEWKKGAAARGPIANLSYMSRVPPSTESQSIYIASLHQINTSRSVEWTLRSPSSPLAKELTKEAALRSFEALHSHYQPLLWIIARVQVAILSSLMWVLQLIHWLLNRKVPVLGRLAEYGLMGGFLDKRMVILLNFQDQAVRMKTVQYTWQNDPMVQRAWLRFYNTSLSLLVDSMLGLAAAYILWHILSPVGFAHTEITSHMTTLWGYEWLNAQIKWIMVGAPAGLKLNLATVQALGGIFTFYIEQWSVIVRHLTQAAPTVLVLLTLLSACFGLSMLVILVHDVVYFVNMHIYWLYSAITRMYSLQLALLRSLWLLFRGKKRNILKARIDSCNASLDQLVVGTLLFTSLIFLLPTTGIYYAFFVYAMCLVLLLQAFAQVFVNFLNYSPLYALLLFLTRSRLLTGGIHFAALSTSKPLASSTSTTSLVQLADAYLASSHSPRANSTYFALCTSLVSLSVIFQDFRKAMAVVAANYQLSKLIDSFLFGNTWQNKRFQPNRLKLTQTGPARPSCEALPVPSKSSD